MHVVEHIETAVSQRVTIDRPPPPNDMHGMRTTTMVFTLPPFMLPSYWKRHQLSDADVTALLEFVPARYVWMSALLSGMDIGTSSIRPSFAFRNDMLISSKAIAMRKIKRGHVLPVDPSVLDMVSAASLDHIPPLPRHCVTEETMHEARRLLVPALSVFEVTEVPGFVNWHGVDYLPHTIEGSAVHCIRIYPSEEYAREHLTQSTCLANTPVRVLYNKVVYVLLDESILLSSDHQYTPSKRQKTEPTVKVEQTPIV
jgi:hypothetical protein